MSDEPTAPRIVWRPQPAPSRGERPTARPNARRRAAPRRPTPLLDALGRDLTALAGDGAFDRLVVRDDLVLRLARALLRREKANPVLLGEPGVGKTALVEALARRIGEGDVDPRLADLRIVELPVAALVAGTFYRGQLEQRVLGLLAEARGQLDLVLFFDELHLVIGAGESANGAMDVANMLKPALARGDIRCIGATTAREYDAVVRRDPALERRFLPIPVAEPTAAETLELLRQIAPAYRRHYDVAIADDALAAAVDLSAEYIRDRRLPDKALDLLDDACARAALPDLAASSRVGAPAVTAETVVAALAERTGVPLARLRANDGPADIGPALAAAVFGQPEAVAAMAAAARLARLGLRPADRPRGVFLFGGPSGVGKTALARAFAAALFGDGERALLRLDLSEYQEQHAVARLIGAPPGYVGHEQGGQLTRFLRQTPAAVVLLDEIDKAHPQALDLFLQIFDAGRVTDGRGDEIDARHAWFVLTTNLPLKPDDAPLRAHLRPEFLNRIDRVIAFAPLSLESLIAIARRAIDDLVRALASRDVTLTADPLALVALCRDEEDDAPANGRTVLRRVEQEVAAPLAATLDATDAPCRLRVVFRDGRVGLA
ncbi:MAG TPA: ATP-dependent Clp protease ATP-binding subunit [Thermomicrobiales bacterium]|nr:ATP-dependent Clp protease ATP-binding subunit [Thermomicrobiales bacterium]